MMLTKSMMIIITSKIAITKIIANVQNICHLIGLEEYNIGVLHSRPQYCIL